MALPVREPATGMALGSAGAGTPNSPWNSPSGAAAQPAWAATPADERARIMRQAARVIEENAQEIMNWIIRETGGVTAKAGYEVAMATGELYHSAALLTQPIGQILPSADPERMSLARRVPVGVVSVITPWNRSAGALHAIRRTGARSRQRRRSEARSANAGLRRLSSGARL